MAQARSFTEELENVYRERYRQLLRVATAILGDEACGHDALQEGFAQALRNQRSFRREGPLEAWVWRIVVNAALAAHRRRVTRREGIEAFDAADTNGYPVVETDVRAWVSALPERQRLVVYLRYYADLDYRSIAQVLGIEEGTVSATLSSAHRALRRALEEVEQ